MPLPIPSLSCEIVIPCYKESERLPSFLESLASELERRGIRGRITIVDDGSGEKEVRRTLEAIAPIIEKFSPLIADPLLIPRNIGKGGAVYFGWRKLAQHGADFLCFVDADGSTDAGEMCRLIQHAMANKDSVDAVFGSRVKLLGKQIERSWQRHIVGRCFATMASLITGVSVYDSQCGAKVVKREAFLSIESALLESGFVFDIELALILLQRGYRLVELPISWTDVPGSKVRMTRDIRRMAQSLLRIRARCGRYVPAEKNALHS